MYKALACKQELDRQGPKTLLMIERCYAIHPFADFCYSFPFE